MVDLILLASAATALVFGAVALIPRRFANAHAAGLRKAVSVIAAWQLLLATVVTVLLGGQILAAGGLFSGGDAVILTTDLLGLSLYFDGVSALMFLLVSFVGWIICRFSVRYLDGDAEQGNHYRWVSLTIGAVVFSVLSGNLIQFFLGWVAISIGVHHLLLHFDERIAAKRAAWTKFAASRFGDAAFLLATVMLYANYGTMEYAALFEAIRGQSAEGTNLNLISLLMVLAAIAKSAQFPFHIWLPQSMETPTPVSALMHAGVVNGGGFLIIRHSPIVETAPWTLSFLAVVGALTAVYGAVVMLTQTSVKRSLAYSTVAQMGFMMLQCGLGAYSAAMLHILAHSLYKAHAFLASGGVISAQADSSLKPATQRRFSIRSVGQTFVSAAAVAALLAVSLTLFGIDMISKPGGLLLGFIFCLALTEWMSSAFELSGKRMLARTIAIAGGLCLAYSASFKFVDVFASSGGVGKSLPAIHSWATVGIVVTGFAAVFVLQRTVWKRTRGGWLQSWYVHASNGFYVEATARRLVGGAINS
jgi:NAD(P)H-quinone oxidoreductase subunit 5